MCFHRLHEVLRAASTNARAECEGQDRWSFDVCLTPVMSQLGLTCILLLPHSQGVWRSFQVHLVVHWSWSRKTEFVQKGWKYSYFNPLSGKRQVFVFYLRIATFTYIITIQLHHRNLKQKSCHLLYVIGANFYRELWTAMAILYLYHLTSLNILCSVTIFKILF